MYCDESVWLPVAEGPRQRGWNVKTGTEEDKLGDSDNEQLRFANENNFTLLTFGDDFLTIVEKENKEHSEIIYVNQSGKHIGEVVKQV
ncbi:MAG: DUF5615 family PIN-like protein, partial [Halobacteria archaeon]